jgi:hypothetical protein
MSNDPIVIPFRRATPPGILSTVPTARRPEPETRRPSRYVMQSHPVSAPVTNPKAIFIACAIALGLYLLGRRLSS